MSYTIRLDANSKKSIGKKGKKRSYVEEIEFTDFFFLFQQKYFIIFNLLLCSFKIIVIKGIVYIQCQRAVIKLSFKRKPFSEYIVIRNGKIVWKHGLYCWYFRLNLKCLGWPYRKYIKTAKSGGFCEELNLKCLVWPYRKYIKTAKNGNFCEGLLSQNDFKAILATFYFYDHGANVSEAVQKIASD